MRLGCANPFTTPRLFELYGAWLMLAIGIWLFIFPMALELSAFKKVLDVFDPFIWAFTCILVGLLRLFALITDSWSGRVLRLITAFYTGAFFWVQFMFALVGNIPVQGVPSMTIVVAFLFITFEAFAVYRVAARG